MPRLLLLQFLNLLMGGGCYLVAVTSFGVWSQAGWSPVATGMAMMAANFAYAAVVSLGGRLADGWGRARTAISGAAVTCVGAGLAFAVDQPHVALVGTVLCFGGSALFFPGNVGLFSDAEEHGGAQVPLHRKVSGYNLGWSSGNLAGFAIAWGLANIEAVRWGYAVSLLGFVVIILNLLRWWSLPPRLLVATGDRADHPALKGLIGMGRIALLLYCLVGMALIALLENTLARTLPPAAAHATATAALVAYSAGYFLTFVVLGWWGGWVMRPWRLFAVALAMPVAGGGMLACGLAGIASPLAFAGCCMALGVSFAAVYTSSIYYSLRLPHGAARAAGLHEMHLGIGSTIGPVLCGGFLSLWHDGITGLAVYLLLGSVLVLGWMLVRLPGITRLLKPA